MLNIRLKGVLYFWSIMSSCHVETYTEVHLFMNFFSNSQLFEAVSGPISPLFGDLLSLLQGLPIFNCLLQHLGACFAENIHTHPRGKVVSVASVESIYLFEHVLGNLENCSKV